MYVVEDETFRRARSILSALAKELTEREESAVTSLIDLTGLIRRSAGADLPAGGEPAYIAAIARSLERLFPIEEMFPRKRRARDR